MAYTRRKFECMRCGLHFVICTQFPERHTIATVACPECRQHAGGFLAYTEEVPGVILEEVPGRAEVFQVAELIHPYMKDGVLYWVAYKIG